MMPVTTSHYQQVAALCFVWSTLGRAEPSLPGGVALLLDQKKLRFGLCGQEPPLSW